MIFRFFKFNLILYTFFLLGISNLSYSKTPEFNFDAKNISNYFSGLVSFLSLFIIFNANADSEILGKWIPEERDAVYDFYKCGDSICAKVFSLKEPIDPETGKPKLDKINEDENLRSRPILGMQFLDGLKKKSKNKWDGGTVYNGRDGKTYTALMKLKNEG